eukprot:COSAG05_NODE_1966_length_3771_cov_6.559368_4_plen_564_part_00
MSLIITRNNGSDPPESYHNYFKDTFTVEPHSQIAVHTVVINRDPTYVITHGNSSFYIYHGAYLSNALVTAGEVGYENYLQHYGLANLWVDQPIQITLREGRYSSEQLAAHIQNRLNYHDFHPSFQNKWTCQVVRTSEGSFDGFKLQNVQRGLDTSASATAVSAVLHGGLAWDAAAQTLTNTVNNTPQTSRIDHPLNGAKGEVVFDIEHIGSEGDWYVGLRRHTFISSYTDKDNRDQLFDFVVKYDELEEGLEYYQWVYDDATGTMKSEEFEYWTRHPGNSDFSSAYDWKTNSSNYKYLRFQLNNQMVSVGLSADNVTYDTLTNSWKAVGYANYALFPSVSIEEMGKYVTLSKFNFVPAYDLTQVKDVIPVVAETADSSEESDKMARFSSSDYTGLSRRVVHASHTDTLNLTTVLITGDAFTDYFVAGNCGDELGFEEPVEDCSNTSYKTIWFESDTVPDTISDEVLHVRVSALNVRSYNGVQSGISKILYTLPRFSDGRSSGRLHITPHEKTYMQLNNTNKLHMNDIHVEFVNSDETLAKDLTDKSYVVFHIKQGGHHRCNCK